jgi:predicted amidophosphoribosyltransferase
MDERFKMLESKVKERLLARHERKLPPNLFAETPLERERLKKRYRKVYEEAVKHHELEDETTIANLIAEYISESISEEVLDPCPDDWE